MNKNIKIYEVEKDGSPEIGRKFIAFRINCREYNIFERLDNEKIRKKNWSNEEDHISEDGNFYAEFDGYIVGAKFDRYIYLDELDLISLATLNKYKQEEEHISRNIERVFVEIFGESLGLQMAKVFSYKNKKGKLEIEYPFNFTWTDEDEKKRLYLEDKAHLDINYLTFRDDGLNKFYESLINKRFTKNESLEIINIISNANWLNHFTRRYLAEIKDKFDFFIKNKTEEN